MKIFSWSKDGGPKSTVHGLFIIEIKPLFSIVLLRFDKGTREAYHSHAFNALTFWLKGEVDEHLIDGTVRTWRPSLVPKYTPRSCFHKVHGVKTTWALSFRGPWNNTWKEYLPDEKRTIVLTNGRKVVL